MDVLSPYRQLGAPSPVQHGWAQSWQQSSCAGIPLMHVCARARRRLPACRDDKLGVRDESKPKQLFTPMPVILITAVPAEKAEAKADALYQCPVYFTEARFRQEVFTASLRTKQPWTHWTTAGVAMFLDVV